MSDLPPGVVPKNKVWLIVFPQSYCGSVLSLLQKEDRRQPRRSGETEWNIVGWLMGRINPCRFIKQIHNHLSSLNEWFHPFLVAMSPCAVPKGSPVMASTTHTCQVIKRWNQSKWRARPQQATWAHLPEQAHGSRSLEEAPHLLLIKGPRRLEVLRGTAQSFQQLTGQLSSCLVEIGSTSSWLHLPFYSLPSSRKLLISQLHPFHLAKWATLGVFSGILIRALK